MPFLRSPPFPGVPSAVAATSAPRQIDDGCAASIDAAALGRADALLARIAELRVGGPFWDPASDIWSQAPSPSAEGGLLARMQGKAAEDQPLSDRERLTLAYRTLIAGAVYRDPFTSEESTAEATVELLGHWRREIERNPGHSGRAVIGTGIARWKRQEVEKLLWGGAGSRLHFVDSASAALRKARASHGILFAWPARTAPDLADRAAEAGVPFQRIEDGFIRSVGLGAECHPPFSIVLDTRGAHYDPSAPSDLEHLLASTSIAPDMLRRAEALIQLIVERRISKYESGETADLPPRGRRRVLVTGQVEDDQSVLLGGGEVRSNLELLRRAREAEPDAEIWFKPHPDVDAGHRKGRVPDRDALAYADQVVRGVPMAALLEAIDAIHVLTSLAGFEALLRGVEVVTHGVPFYAGWGLTRDLGDVPSRRNRRLSLAELAAAVLLLYPRYLDPLTGLPCPPEVLIRRLAEQRAPQDTWLTRLRHLQGKLRRLASELRAS